MILPLSPDTLSPMLTGCPRDSPLCPSVRTIACPPPCRTRCKEPKPFVGLTHKPPCALCEQEAAYPHARRSASPAPPYLQGRTIPSLFMRWRSVERFMPRRTAAPFGPASTHFVSFRVSR